MSTPQHEDWAAAQLLRVAELTADFRGARYLQALVVTLTRMLQARFAMVVVRAAGRDNAQVLAMADGEDLAQPFRYATESLPCHTVMEGQPVAVPCNIIEFFPGAAEIDAYVGHPLRARNGKVIGLLAVMHTAALSRERETARLLRCLAGHVAAELEVAPEILPVPLDG